MAAKVKNPKQYLMTPPAFRKDVLVPLVNQTRLLVNAAIAVGQEKHDAASPEDVKNTSKALNDKFRVLLKAHLKSILNLSHYHRRVYALNSNKAQRVLRDEPSKKVNRSARTLAPYDPAFLKFLDEAADSHESLKFFKGFSVLNTSSRLHGMSTQGMLPQFLLCYAAVHERFNSSNRQFIQPNDLMLKHLGAGIEAALKRQCEAIPQKSADYPGQLRFPFLQTLISYYRRPATTDADKEKLRKLAGDVEVVSVLSRETETLNAARRLIWEDVKKNLPKREKPAANPKVTRAKATVRSVKRAASAIASAAAAVPTETPAAV